MSITHKTDHTAEAQENLVAATPFGSSTVLMGILAAILDQIQLIEDDAAAIAAARDVDTATGVQLDQVGALVGQPRWGRNDDDYRILIRARILANSSKGTPETLISIASLLLGGATITYRQQGAACYRLQWEVATATSTETCAALTELITLATRSGVEFGLIETLSTPSPTFILDSETAGLDQGLLTSRRVA